MSPASRKRERGRGADASQRWEDEALRRDIRK
jgi:hypothetical protein